jgi:hypothetical protein
MTSTQQPMASAAKVKVVLCSIWIRYHVKTTEPTLKLKNNWTPYEVKSDWNHIDWKGIENVLSEFNTERIKKNDLQPYHTFQ